MVFVISGVSSQICALELTKKKLSGSRRLASPALIGSMYEKATQKPVQFPRTCTS